VHALVTQMLLKWCADASGQTPTDVIQRLALTINSWLDESGTRSQGTDPA
jgi:hypothetical protein